MSLTQIRSTVENFVNSVRNELLIIKGDWGTGKSYFWDNLIGEARTNRVFGCDYYAKVSVFGLNTLDELRTSIAVSRVETRTRRKLDSINTRLARLLKEFGKVPVIEKYGGGSIGSLLFAAVRDTLVCIDDIERRGSRLEITDILGLATQLKEERNCKVVLIVNERRLGEAQEEFGLHGEKVVDREIQFSLTPEESFACVFKPNEPYLNLIKDCVFALEIRNIRILKRIQRYIEDITPFIRNAEKQTAEEVIRSLIMFVWSRYGKGNEAPPMDFVLDYSISSSWLKREKGTEETDEEKKWSSVLSSYKYFRIDEIDTHLANFVRDGYVGSADFGVQLEKRNQHYKAQRGDSSYQEAWALYTSSFENNEQEVVDGLSSSLRTHAEILGPKHLQEIISLFKQLERGDEANAMVDDYFRLRNSLEDIQAFELFKRSSFSHEINDEYFLRKLDETIALAPADTRTLAEVIDPISMTNGWEPEDIRYLNTFSVDDYYHFFRSYKGEKLYWCVKKCLDFRELKGNNGIFEAIGKKAEQALLQIASESRLNGTRVATWFKLGPETN
jgi:hypothetical protein